MKKWIKTQTPFAHYRGQGTHAWQKALWVKQAWRTMRLVWGASWQEEPEHPSFPAGAQQSEIIVCRKSPHEYISIRQDAVARRTWGSFKSQSSSCPHFFFLSKAVIRCSLCQAVFIKLRLAFMQEMERAEACQSTAGNCEAPTNQLSCMCWVSYGWTVFAFLN